MFNYHVKLAIKSMRRNPIITGLMVAAIAVGILALYVARRLHRGYVLALETNLVSRAAELSAEPEDYIPRGNWYGQFKGKKLNAGLNLRRDIKGVTGATMTARATLSAVRRSLAIHEVIFGKPGP